ncbi:uncharacterized protein Triagg1_9794 [Trichoderma aggressivum f. europaeum]|uniref:SWIM-type domain-containing protein n=1 Tax=Trichoderma aggressivum f. europaeum TaxID=173218 RepID=A0AAE1LVC4_9HYPO|nr:hypothetical protein Triagg1_9794 [Trichoderma aggressivum f. europaeum]
MGDHRLPSHHQLFAALIPPSPLPGVHAASDFTDNPDAVESIRETPSSAEDVNWRRQLLTLHVIFPSLLLPALDLLDRDLVTRLLVADQLQKAPQGAAPASVSPDDILKHEGIENTNEPSEDYIPDSLQAMDHKDQICMYTVQSAVSTTSRRKRHTPQTTKVYAVHLDAWSCSCGGFALDAYSHYDVVNSSEKLQNPPPKGLFGNLGLDRLTSLEDFPCCKHLLACLLAEKWRKTPGGHVQDRYTTKEELAGIIGGH